MINRNLVRLRLETYTYPEHIFAYERSEEFRDMIESRKSLEFDGFVDEPRAIEAVKRFFAEAAKLG